MDFSIKSLVKGSGVLILSTASLRLLNFLLLPFYTSYLTPADYGISNLATDTTLILYYIFSFALDWGMIAFFHDEETEEHRRRVFSTAYIIMSLGATLCLCSGAIAQPLSQLVFGESGYGPFMFCSFALAAARLLFFAPDVNFRLRNNMKLIGIGNCATLLVTLLLNIYFVAGLRLGYWALTLSPLIAETGKSIAYFFLSRRDRGLRYFDLSLAKKMLLYSLPIIPTLLLNWITQLSDQFVLNAYHGQDAVGLYSVGSKIVGFLGVATSAFLSAYTAYVHANANDENGPPTFAWLAHLVFGVLTAVGFAVTMLSREIIVLMTAEAYHSAYPVVGLLVFAHITYVMYGMINYGLTIKKRSKLVLLISCITATVNLVGNLLLIPRGSFVAAAFTTFISHLVSMILTYIFAQQQYPCPYTFWRILLCLVGLSFIAYLFLDSALWIRALVWLAASGVLIALFWKDVRRVLGVARMWWQKRKIKKA